MKTFKRIVMVERVYESDYLTAQRFARAFEVWDEHKKMCAQCNNVNKTPEGLPQDPSVKFERCWRGKEIFAKVQAATEKRYEEYEIPKTA